MAETKKNPHPGRIALIIALITLWSCAIAARLVQLQVLKHQDFVQLALKGQIVTRSVLAPRGAIYESHMDEIATSTTVSTVAAEPRRIRDIRLAVAKLAAILEMDPDDLDSRFSDPGRQVFQVLTPKPGSLNSRWRESICSKKACAFIRIASWPATYWDSST
jgi:cell division protein FtsI/penicillin-binding protein 2